MAKVLMDQHFDVYGLPDQLHSDNGKEFVNNLWVKLLTISLYNPSSNPVERFHRTLSDMLKTQGPGVLENWDLWLNASVFANNTITPQ